MTQRSLVSVLSWRIAKTRALPPHAMAATHGFTLASLSDETLRFVFVRLPVDARARAAAVCRLWRDVLKD